MNTSYAQQRFDAMNAQYSAPRLAEVKASASIEQSALAAQLRRSNPDLIDLTVGEPDFATPDSVLQEAVKAVMEHRTHYTNVAGIDKLRDAIAEKFRRENQLFYEREEICVCNGAKAAIFNALLATISEGDDVLLIAPFWVSYPEMVRIAGGRPVILATNARDGFRLRAEQLKDALSARTRWIIINSPSNPAGVVYSAEELRAFAAILAEWTRVLILSDEVYEHFSYNDQPVSVALALEDFRSRVLTVNSLSKSFGMTGWRIGYAGGARSLVEPMTRLAAHSTANACTISQWAAVNALSRAIAPAVLYRTEYRKRRDVVVDLLNRIPGLECQVPNGAFYVFPSCAGILGRSTKSGVRLYSDKEIVRELLLTAGVATVTGSSFGIPNHFRLCLAAPCAILIEACTRIRLFCETLC